MSGLVDAHAVANAALHDTGCECLQLPKLLAELIVEALDCTPPRWSRGMFWRGALHSY